MLNQTFVFTSDLSNWDISSSTNTRKMFAWAYEFNSDLSNWDTSNVTSMSEMFW
jgi:surface protein